VLREFPDGIPLAHIAPPLPLVYILRKLPADLDGAIRAEAVEYNDFVAPGQAFQAPCDFPLFIESENTR
jgi:hypothetical protein